MRVVSAVLLVSAGRAGAECTVPTRANRTPPAPASLTGMRSPIRALAGYPDAPASRPPRRHPLPRSQAVLGGNANPTAADVKKILGSGELGALVRACGPAPRDRPLL